MKKLLIWTILLLWYSLGVSGFIYYESKIDDIRIDDMPVIFLFGFAGPLVWGGGYMAFDFPTGKFDKVLVQKRDK